MKKVTCYKEYKGEKSLFSITELDQSGNITFYKSRFSSDTTLWEEATNVYDSLNNKIERVSYDHKELKDGYGNAIRDNEGNKKFKFV